MGTARWRSPLGQAISDGRVSARPNRVWPSERLLSRCAMRAAFCAAERGLGRRFQTLAGVCRSAPQACQRFGACPVGCVLPTLLVCRSYPYFSFNQTQTANNHCVKEKASFETSEGARVPPD